MHNSPNSQTDLIKATHVTRSFGHGPGAVSVLKGVNLSVPSGSFIAFRGRSGSGKTTLINLLGALDKPTEGSILFAGQEITKYSDRERDELRRTKFGLIFQSSALLPMMSAYENVDFTLRIAGISKQDRDIAVLRALEHVGLKSRMHHRPFEMSGGEQQRTAIARAIAHNPTLLLADEPTAELDSRTGLQIMKVFRDLVRLEGMTVILTTHDPTMMDLVDQVYELEDGQFVETQ
ncbi:ABC transporter ATP-binding protein [Paenibacillus psychroresistens]|uniref:ABC transporter ATP-binding protein n=1 Tax=Paenibacillus psychroresistens TaxID=1778678 RepID=A0A6B8RMS7_9BACL|nr:ABC transporter ATP-binding protein [Paenibacillus psychroresistens]QGQ97349.1 ABC transporter ATP-binding protein [Paenibacillus psychroresistens]